MVSDYGRTITIAKLDSGKFVKYDLCTAAGNKIFKHININEYQYIGTGIIHSCNRVIQKGNERQDFYKRKSKRFNRYTVLIKE